MNWSLWMTFGIVLCALRSASGGTPNPNVAVIEKRSEDANQALVRGDIDQYLALIQHAEDYTLMNPFGGAPTRGFHDTPERRAGMKKFFKTGLLKQETVATFASDDLIVLVTIERAHGEFGGVPEQDWSLRVTQVYRRDGQAWELVHRHADPLANGITVPQAAALAKGAEK